MLTELPGERLRAASVPTWNWCFRHDPVPALLPAGHASGALGSAAIGRRGTPVGSLPEGTQWEIRLDG